MLTCRSIRPAIWTHAHDALVFYFTRRHGTDNAEDLAQETLAAVLARDDFQFEKEEDFLRVCYGFAARISHQGFRDARKYAAEELDPDLPPLDRSGCGLNVAEIRLLLDEVIREGKARLNQEDWFLIERAATAERGLLGGLLPAAGANYIRVRLHRARRKLAKITGWST